MNKIYKIKVGKQIKNDSFHGKICYRWIIQLNKRAIWRHIKVQPFVAPLCAPITIFTLAIHFNNTEIRKGDKQYVFWR